MLEQKCFLCDRPASVQDSLDRGVCDHIVQCKRCGDYVLADFVNYHIRSLAAEDKARLSIHTRNNPGTKFITLPANRDEVPQIDAILAQIGTMSVGERVERALLAIARKIGGLGRTHTLSPEDDAPFYYALDSNELLRMLQHWRDEGVLIPTAGGDNGVELPVKGWMKVEEIRRAKKGKDSQQAFVAMWFDPGLDRAYYEGISPAIKECGFRPVRVDLEEDNDKICDVIIAEIRQSRFVVADFTGQRPGVYYEAGFALGLNLPVIRTCRKGEEDKLHFDTRQYRHILWSDPKELAAKLAPRVKATVL